MQNLQPKLPLKNIIAETLTYKNILLLYFFVSFFIMIGCAYSFSAMFNFDDTYTAIPIPDNFFVSPGLFIAFFLHLILFLYSIALYGPVKDNDIGLRTTKILVYLFSAIFIISFFFSLLVFLQVYHYMTTLLVN